MVNYLQRQQQDELRAKGEVLTRERQNAPIPEADYQRILMALYAEAGMGAATNPEQAKLALLATHAVNDMDMRELAQQRAERIREFLVKEGGVSEQRIYLLDVVVGSKPGQTLETLLQLNGS